MNILMLTESKFPSDVRVRNEAFKLTEKGHSVSIIAIKGDSQSYFEDVQGVKVYRIPQVELFKKGKQLSRDGKHRIQRIFILAMGVLGYGFEFLYFTVTSFLLSLLIWPIN